VAAPPTFTVALRNWIFVSLAVGIVGIVVGGWGVLEALENARAGRRLTTWARDPLRAWIDHSQNCHSNVPQHPTLPAPQCGNGPADHIAPPPPPPSWDE
jgi:hypothetical protein